MVRQVVIVQCYDWLDWMHANASGIQYSQVIIVFAWVMLNVLAEFDHIFSLLTGCLAKC